MDVNIWDKKTQTWIHEPYDSTVKTTVPYCVYDKNKHLYYIGVA